MGKFMVVFGIWMCVCALMVTYQNSVSALVPGLTLSDAIFDSNALVPYLDRNTTSGVTTFNNTLGGVLPTQSTTGTDASGNINADWTQSTWKWSDIFTPIIDFIGTPYFLFMWMSPGGDAAVFGALLSILNLVLLVAFVTGRID